MPCLAASGPGHEAPGRSPELGRYRDIIVTTAERILLAILSDLSNPNLNLTQCVAFRKWFAEDGVAPSDAQQRLSRARPDVRGLLGTLISREELRS